MQARLALADRFGAHHRSTRLGSANCHFFVEALKDAIAKRQSTTATFEVSQFRQTLANSSVPFMLECGAHLHKLEMHVIITRMSSPETGSGRLEIRRQPLPEALY